MPLGVQEHTGFVPMEANATRYFVLCIHSAYTQATEMCHIFNVRLNPGVLCIQALRSCNRVREHVKNI